MNDFFPPLINFDLPVYPQVLNVNIEVLTNAGTASSSHAVKVVDLDYNNNKAIYYFSTDATGKVTNPANAPATVESYGPSPDGTQQFYLQTIIGTYSFGGDNFPLSAWPNEFNWPDGSTINHDQFDLDATLNFQPTPDNSKTFTVESDYSYTQWARITFLGYQWPYLPGASLANPTAKAIVFDLRQPTEIRQAPNQPITCSTACPTCPHMAGASFDRFQAGIAITDTPISYTPGVGMTMAFTLAYHQRLTNQPTTFNYTNVGPLWKCNWISYIAGGPTSGQTDAIYYAPDGSQYTYGGYQQTVVQGMGSVIKQGDFRGSEGWTHATLHYRQNPERYERWLADGTVETYAQATGLALNRLFFLTLITDPQGNVTTFKYNATAAINGQARLDAVVDPKGGELDFGYNTTNPLQIARVTRSCDGLSAQFQYTSGQLTSITDPIGITSSFQYVSGVPFIRTMTTPYGTTTFHSADGPGVLEADMTNPLGQTERVEYQEFLATSLVAACDGSPPSGTGLTIDNTKLNTANTFYWDRRAMADAVAGGIAIDSAAFYALGNVSHWAESMQGSIPVPLCTKRRLEGRVWFNYPNQPDPDHVDVLAAGATTSPSITARVLDNTDTQISRASYNANGLITQSIDPLGRTTNYAYAGNNIDLVTVKQTNSGSASGTGFDTLSTMTYNGQHLPLITTDASGRTTTMTYNGQGQLLTSTDALSETTTLVYDSNGDGYLHTVTGPIAGSTTTYTYDAAGRTHTVTDSEGYVLTMAYDNLDRLTTTTYPDTTTDQTVYDRLDVARTIDRQGRVTSNQYDAIRELLLTTDPMGRTTAYTWCTCGGLSTLTDANNHTTTWGLDGEGRVTSKTYADASVISYVYEIQTSRLHSMTDAATNGTVYVYNDDNTLHTTTYTAATGFSTTPSGTFTYDTVYNRVLSMIDGTGTTNYTYNTIPGTVTTGAGRLHTVSVPVATATGTITYGYDALGRVNNRALDSGNTVATTFDALGRVSSVTNALTPTGSFTYAYLNQTSLLSSVTAPASTGLSTSYTYFSSGDTQDWERLETIQNMHSGTQLSKFDYTYKPVGTITTWTQQADSSTAVVNTLSYDGADQLINAVQSGGGTASNAYKYDPAGNRLSEATASATVSGTFNNLNQLMAIGPANNLTISGTTTLSSTFVSVNAVSATLTGSTSFSASVPLATGTNTVSVVAVPTSTSLPTVTKRFSPLTTTGTAATALTYDVNGNTHTDENGNTYTWDVLSRLTRITYPSTAYTTMSYDGVSRRTQIAEYNGSGTLTSTKNYIWIGSEIAEERDVTNTVTKRFFPQGEQQSGTNYYYAFDHLASVREMLNSSGSIVARYTYDAFGNGTLVSGTDMSTFQFAHMYKHQMSDLYFTSAGNGGSTGRPYKDGRFPSRDPIEENGGSNLYIYCLNDPINAIDPLGLDILVLYNKNSVPLPNGPAGHVAEVIGQSSNLDYESFAPAWHGSPLAPGQLTTTTGIPSMNDAKAYAKSLGYTDYMLFKTTPAQDAKALAATKAYEQTFYSGKGSNCQNMVEDSLNAAGVKHNTGFTPYQVYHNNMKANGGKNDGEGPL